MSEFVEAFVLTFLMLFLTASAGIVMYLIARVFYPIEISVSRIVWAWHDRSAIRMRIPNRIKTWEGTDNHRR